VVADDRTSPTAEPRWTRRRFLATSGAVAASMATGLAAGCEDQSDTSSARRPPAATSGGEPDPAGIVAADLPAEDEIFGWIRTITEQGIRRPGYPADVWAEDWIERRFREFSLTDVHREEVPLRSWRPGRSSLRVTTAAGTTRRIDHFPVPYPAPARSLDLLLVDGDAAAPGTASGKAALVDVALITLPAASLAHLGDAPQDMTGRIVDDAAGTLASGTHTVPFSTRFQEVMEPALAAGAEAFIGTLTGGPGNTYEYFVPYDAKERPIPGVFVSERDGTWLREQMAAGTVRLRLTVDSEMFQHTSFNIVGDLPGADDEIVMIGSHHDGPWASAVEDASGTSLVLAQARYWSRRPTAERPHRLRFILQAGHMSGGAGLQRYVSQHAKALDRVVLEIHLEHASLEAVEDESGAIVVTDQPVPRWFFTSRHEPLERAVATALAGEELTRSMVMAPNAIGELPPTDGNAYFAAGVPVVHFLAAPWYLFDSVDTIDKIDRAHLVALTRATARLVLFTASTSAAELRAAPPTL
jgi:Peptidase family M28